MMLIRGWPMSKLPDIALDALPGLLAHINPDTDRDSWVKIGMGVKAHFGEDGFNDWNSWSQNSPDYKPADALSAWKSFKGAKVTIGTVVHLAKEGGWKLTKRELTAKEKRERKAEQEARRKQRQAEVEADEAQLAAMQAEVQRITGRLLAEFTQARGKSEYLERKQVPPYGVRFITRNVVLSIDAQLMRCDLWAGDDIARFFANLPNPRPDHHSFMKLDAGTFVVPLRDIDGVVWSFQAISASGTKLFPKFARKQGCMHCIGTLDGAEVIVAAEGYATAASVAQASEWPTVMTVDVGNMAVLARLIRQKHPAARLILAGDDDPKPDGKNPGRTAAEAIAAELGITVVFPVVPEQVAA